MPRGWKLPVIVCLAIVGGALGWQRLAGEKLRTEIELLQARDREAARLQEENRRLAGEAGPGSEWDNLRTDHAEMLRLRGAIEELKAREKAAADPGPKPAPPAAKPAPVAEVPMDPDMIPASAWKNVGRGTPAATLETALWAASGGDMDTLAEAIHLDPNSTIHTQLEAALAGLPPELRAQYGTPERLLALMVAKDMPSVAMKVVEPLQPPNFEVPPDVAPLQVKLQDSRGTKKTMLVMQKFSGEWQLIVPPGVVKKYVDLLTAAPASTP